MNKIELTITAESPLAIGVKKPGSVSEASDYIPGSVIRGAVASVLLQQSGQENQDLSQEGGDFQTLFLGDRAAIFHNAYPGTTDTEVLVIPTTAVSSKTKPGFKPKGNGVFDTLIDRFCAEQFGHPYDPNDPADNEGRVEPYSAFFSQKKGQYQTHAVTKRLLTRVGINRRRATAQEQILYSIEVLNETQGKENDPAIYRSKIYVEDDALAKSLIGFIQKHHFRLGGATSRGLGKVKIEPKASNVKNNLNERLAKFNQQLRQRWQTWNNIFGKKNQQWQDKHTYFTLDLQSDAILTEDWLRTTVISPAMLCDFAGVDDASLELCVAYSSYDYRSGWNSAWGRMKDIELITNKGGVYLFSTENPKLWEPALSKLEVSGVGDRTPEGFGQVLVCNPFHLVFRENAV
ncbi:type III-D CRISPR-associated RAMP protein Csx10 [Laspinema olomoucense]|uniref:CRISPR-associated RAMP protein Csx10 n=1 Tax=Laspinema olomoucense D3b TaxID=2953688 RepID=A0ABT2N8J4_9CYAN|nr:MULTISPECIES: CRISPR-associated RAMP protein Csx10 [unclassified Laspinema]MCT7979028.1 CRISPR-associated RAMP protein Csx10 [Laspinema sp. D3b]MCT7987605.1 CRISPR-associated RAMP protein Csx10 [Laspinema sp. D3a]